MFLMSGHNDDRSPALRGDETCEVLNHSATRVQEVCKVFARVLVFTTRTSGRGWHIGISRENQCFGVLLALVLIDLSRQTSKRSAPDEWPLRFPKSSHTKCQDRTRKTMIRRRRYWQMPVPVFVSVAKASPSHFPLHPSLVPTQPCCTRSTCPPRTARSSSQ